MAIYLKLTWSGEMGYHKKSRCSMKSIVSRNGGKLCPLCLAAFLNAKLLAYILDNSTAKPECHLTAYRLFCFLFRLIGWNTHYLFDFSIRKGYSYY